MAELAFFPEIVYLRERLFDRFKIMSGLQAGIAALAITFLFGLVFGIHVLYRRYLVKDRKDIKEMEEASKRLKESKKKP